MSSSAVPRRLRSLLTPGVSKGDGAVNEPRPQARAAWRSLLPAAAAVLVLFAWLPAWGAPYQYDDFNTPVGDAASQSLSSFWQSLPRTLRPLTKLTYALESSCGAVSAPARRLLNALLAASCLVLLKALLETVAKLPAALALLVASIWAVHPANAEMFVALAGRPVLLSLCLTLGSALALMKERPKTALALAALALLARETSLPWLVVCSALVAHRRGVTGARLVALALVGLAGGALILASSSGVRGLLASTFAASGAWNRLGLQWAALSRGTSMLFTSPAAFTPDMEFAPVGVARLLLILTTASLYAGALWLIARYPRLRVPTLLWLCLVLPTHSVVPKLDVLTARPIASGFAALLVLAAAAGGPWLLRAAQREAAVTLLLGAAFAVSFPLTRHRAALYADPIVLWRDAAGRTQQTVRPLVNLGTLLAQDGQLRAAEQTFTLALRRDPASADIRLRLRAVRRASQLGALRKNHPDDYNAPE